jgi:hypothetical protein
VGSVRSARGLSERGHEQDQRESWTGPRDGSCDRWSVASSGASASTIPARSRAHRRARGRSCDWGIGGARVWVWGEAAILRSHFLCQRGESAWPQDLRAALRLPYTGPPGPRRRCSFIDAHRLSPSTLRWCVSVFLYPRFCIDLGFTAASRSTLSFIPARRPCSALRSPR